MPFDALDQETLDKLPRLSQLHASYGVQVNAMGVNELFALYERTGFLYPEKAARLIPNLERVRENWRRMLRAGESLMYILTAGDEEQGRASIAVWRTTHHGWTSQHLVCEDNPLASRAVILAGSAASILRGTDESHQNWFRPENRFPSRVFGTIVNTIGDSLSCVQRHMYFALPRRLLLSSAGGLRIARYDASHKDALLKIVTQTRGSVYAKAEDLAADAELKSVDELYRRVALRRTRQIWLAYRPNQHEPVGAAIAYRGPLGINFSYIENRCDLLVHPALPESDAPAVVASLLRAASTAYEDFELDTIPVIAEQAAAPALLQLGAEFLRDYCQGIWLKNGQLRFYRHVDGFYARLLSRVRPGKSVMQPSLIA